MNRKKFVESLGGDCQNWTWSWSFINRQKKQIIFGAWNHNSSDGRQLILSDRWETNKNGRKQSGYSQSIEHLKLVESGEYELLTFEMFRSEEKTKNGQVKIKKIVPQAVSKTLTKEGGNFYADEQLVEQVLPEEVIGTDTYIEGATKVVTVNKYERDAKARKRCIAHFGCECQVCGFDFEKVYGDLGKGYIHVHHIVPLSEIGEEYEVNPEKDLVPLCPNCHAMIHRTQSAKSLCDLKLKINKNNFIKRV